ncbi:MAG: hypothetical protein H6662_08580 [Ardenticatenaceae bacterium]|nr:hypothetical protein [Ardenticatenaceae bacterium]MCB9003344.1 hypothetical protein [Ardenticatenaceae bacterium]
MYGAYQATYKDKFGEEKTEVQLEENGHQVRIFLRGVEFLGTKFNQLSPNDNNANFKHFLIGDDGCLQTFNLKCEIPVTVISSDKIDRGLLKITCAINNPEEDYLKLDLFLNKQSFQSSGSAYGFEDEMHSLGSKLPTGTYLQICSNCLFSDYNPYVNSGLMGELVCFVNNKDKKNTNRGKGYPGWHEVNPVFVQEIFSCQKFEPKEIFMSHNQD